MHRHDWVIDHMLVWQRKFIAKTLWPPTSFPWPVSGGSGWSQLPGLLAEVGCPWHSRDAPRQDQFRMCPDIQLNQIQHRRTTLGRAFRLEVLRKSLHSHRLFLYPKVPFCVKRWHSSCPISGLTAGAPPKYPALGNQASPRSSTTGSKIVQLSLWVCHLWELREKHPYSNNYPTKKWW